MLRTIISKQKLIIWRRIASVGYVVTEMKWLITECIKQAQNEYKSW